MTPFTSICVFSGCADYLSPVYCAAADQLGSLLGREGIHLVYGAGKTGLMGAVADAVLHTGGEVIGVACDSLNSDQLIHSGLSRLEVTPDIQSRKTRMYDLSDAFIALPGGFGTFDELFEVLTLAQIGLHHKPIGLLNVNGYFEPFMQLVKHALQERFIYPEHAQLFSIEEQPEALLAAMQAYQVPDRLERWVTRPVDPD